MKCVLSLSLAIDALFALVSKEAREGSFQDRKSYWGLEAAHVGKPSAENRTRDLYHLTRIYAGKTAAMGVLNLQDLQSRSIEAQ